MDEYQVYSQGSSGFIGTLTDNTPLPLTSPTGGASIGGGITTTFCWPDGGWYPYPWPGYWTFPLPQPIMAPPLPPRIQAALEVLKLGKTKTTAKLHATALKLYAEYLEGKVWA